MMISNAALLSCMVICLHSTASFAESQQMLRGSPSSKEVIDCRVTVQIEYGKNLKEHDCIPIVDGEETDEVFPVHLPKRIINTYKSDLSEGNMYVNIQGVMHRADESLAVGENATFFVYDENNKDLPNHIKKNKALRKLSSNPGTTGYRVLGVVRVRTTEGKNQYKEPRFTADQLYKGIFGNGHNNDGITAINQFKSCSGGKLNWVPHPKDQVVELTLPESMDYYTSTGGLDTPVTKALKAKLGVSKMLHYAHNTMYVYPEMPNGFGFTARAPLNHWRSIYHNDWSLSLQAIMHELGHNFNLGHAGHGNDPNGDATGMMGAGSTTTNGPLTCFNSFNHYKLGWFTDRTVRIDTATMNRATQVKVAAFVDYDITKNDEPVIVNINDQYFAQYNRKAKHNNGTREFEDRLTFHVADHRTAEASLLIGGIDVGQEVVINASGPGDKLFVRVCRRVVGSADSAGVLVVSFSFDSDTCGPSHAPTKAPVKTPQAVCDRLTYSGVNLASEWTPWISGSISQDATAIRWSQTSDQHKFWSGPEYIHASTSENRECLVPGSTWELSARIKLVERGTNAGVECDSNSHDAQTACPALTLFVRNSDNAFFQATLRGYPNGWRKNAFNEFVVRYTVPRGTGWNEMQRKFRVVFNQFPSNADVLLRNFAVVAL